MKTSFATILCAGTVFAVTPAFGQNNEPRSSREACDILVSYLQENRGYDFPVTLEEARRQQQARDDRSCRDSIEQINASLEEDSDRSAGVNGAATEPGADRTSGAEIVVQQRPPAIEVEQATPRVTVDQARPEVTVSQPQPEIVVRQPAPTVTIDIPQPEITIHMPEPDVNVAMAQPQVEVHQPQPQVRLAETGEPDVQIQQQEAEVLIQRQPEQQADVQFNDSEQPTVRYQREEPRVRVNQGEGQPQVRIERAGEQQARAGQTANAERQRLEGATQDQPQTTGSVRQDVRVSDLLETEVVTRQGNKVGTVERVMVNPDTGETAIVLGLDASQGEEGRLIGVSLNDLQLKGEQLVLGLSSDQLRRAPEWRAQQGFRDAAGNQNTQIRSQTE